jgi:hypothetical protein
MARRDLGSQLMRGALMRWLGLNPAASVSEIIAASSRDAEPEPLAREWAETLIGELSELEMVEALPGTVPPRYRRIGQVRPDGDHWRELIDIEDVEPDDPHRWWWCCEVCESSWFLGDSQTHNRECPVLERDRLRELVRVAQHHIDRRWPQSVDWLAATFELLGSQYACSGTPKFEPVTHKVVAETKPLAKEDPDVAP